MLTVAHQPPEWHFEPDRGILEHPGLAAQLCSRTLRRDRSSCSSCAGCHGDVAWRSSAPAQRVLLRTNFKTRKSFSLEAFQSCLHYTLDHGTCTAFDPATFAKRCKPALPCQSVEAGQSRTAPADNDWVKRAEFKVLRLDGLCCSKTPNLGGG